jgi:hypothetical protein
MARLEKDIHVKMRNLDRVNKSIKDQLRLMEAQMRIMGNAPGGAIDVASKSLIDEFKKSMTNTDSFENSSSSVTEEQAVDPTVPLDVNNLLSGAISEKTIDPTPDISPSEPQADENNNVLSESDELIFDDPDVVEEISQDKQTIKEVEEALKKGPEPVIDLSEVIDFKQNKGGTDTSKKVIETEKKAEPKQKEVRKDQKIGIDIDDLLDSLQP